MDFFTSCYFRRLEEKWDRRVPLFHFFPLGAPNLQFGIIAISFFAGLLNLCNTFASIQAASELIGDEAEHKQYRNSLFMTGGFTIFRSLAWPCSVYTFYFIDRIFAEHSNL
ncbi:hypothetical protein RCO48_20880 [Peribacillus frigoritolerans]|nr:hypothetical protein [Peribacillus frigoritolerans]